MKGLLLFTFLGFFRKSISLQFKVNINRGRTTSTPLRVFNYDSSIDNIREKLSSPPEKIIGAVEGTPNFRLSVADAAARSGLSLFESKKGLMTLSTLTGGDIEVTDKGELIYSYPRNLRSILNRRSWGQKLKNLWRFLFPKLYYLVRISVGFFLFVSISIVTTAFMVASSSNSSSNNSNDRNNNNNHRLSSTLSSSYTYRNSSPGVYIDLGSVFDLLFYSTRADGYRKKKVSFLESFFSFVFGDGNPNEEFKTTQYQEVAKLIQARNGIVTAEELAVILDAPFDPSSTIYTPKKISPLNTTDRKNTHSQEHIHHSELYEDSPSVIVNESWVLPALLQFGGEPIVSEDGQLYYSFEEFMSTINLPSSTSSTTSTSSISTTTSSNYSIQKMTIPQEQNIPFSLSDPNDRSMAIMLGIFNVIGVTWLSSYVSNPAVLALRSPMVLSLMRIQPLLAMFAVAYFAIPTVRAFYLKQANKDILIRNERRKKWAEALSSTQFQSKFNQACQIAKQMNLNNKLKGNNNIIYSTKQSEEF